MGLGVVAIADPPTAIRLKLPFSDGLGGAFLIHSLIYSFHMPLMFALSGVLATKLLDLNNTESRNNYINDRFRRLMIPYFFVGLVYLPFKLILSQIAQKPYEIHTIWQIFLGENPDGGLWFLWALFVIQFVAVFILNKSNLNKIGVLSFLISIAVIASGWSTFWIDDAIYCFSFFLMGLVIRIKDEQRALSQRRTAPILTAIAFLICLVVYVLTNTSIMKSFCAVTGIFFIFYICKLIEGRKLWINRILEYLGQRTMEIYILHGIIMVVVRALLHNILHLNFYVVSVTMFVFGLVLPVYISQYIIKRNKNLNKLILGAK